MTLEEYEEVCPTCKGKGEGKSSLATYGWICCTCWGSGKINWIDKIKEKFINEIRRI